MHIKMIETRDITWLSELLCKHTICSTDGSKVMWPTLEDMRNLHHIYSDMTGLVVIIT